MELVLNDQGRAAMSERLGTMVEKVEGTVLSQTADSYTIAVAKVSQFNGNASTWNGEQVTVRKDQTAGYQVRRLNVLKTVAVAAVVTVALAYLFFGSAITGGGTDDKPTPPDGGPPSRVIGR